MFLEQILSETEQSPSNAMQFNHCHKLATAAPQ
jgi:hypothetical protein